VCNNAVVIVSNKDRKRASAQNQSVPYYYNTYLLFLCVLLTALSFSQSEIERNSLSCGSNRLIRLVKCSKTTTTTEYNKKHRYSCASHYQLSLWLRRLLTSASQPPPSEYHDRTKDWLKPPNRCVLQLCWREWQSIFLTLCAITQRYSISFIHNIAYIKAMINTANT